MQRRQDRIIRMAKLSSLGLSLALPGLASAQASPFLTGATALQTNILAWLTPIAVILVMALGAMAMANRLSWGWCIGAILGIAIAFGAPQIVTWVRGMFGV
jgi:type IV secretion system protein VirB2